MLLDPGIMPLSTFKDFGNAGGSLIWAVRQEENWRYSFARYGAENTKLLLVKYDDPWSELGRWTYPPPEIFCELHEFRFSRRNQRVQEPIRLYDLFEFPRRRPRISVALSRWHLCNDVCD